MLVGWGERWTGARVRVVALLAGVGFVAAAFGVRAFTGTLVESTGLLEQSTGTALYAAAVYAGVIFVRPRAAPGVAAAAALGFCWAVEFFQLTGVPAALSAHSLVARLVLGVSFDPADLGWYVAGVLPVAVGHRQLRRRG